MAARNTRRAACGATAAVLLAGGLWAGRSLSTSTATPAAETGTIGSVSPGADQFTIRFSGHDNLTSYGLPATVQWRDAYGNWNDGTRPACMRPGTHGQQVTLGLVSTEPAAGAPGGQFIVWLECARKPVPRFPVVTPPAG